MLLGLCLNPDSYTLCFGHLQPLFLFQDLNKVVTLSCDLFNGFECFAKSSVRKSSAIAICSIEAYVRNIEETQRGNISCLQPA